MNLVKYNIMLELTPAFEGDVVNGLTIPELAKKHRLEESALRRFMKDHQPELYQQFMQNGWNRKFKALCQ